MSYRNDSWEEAAANGIVALFVAAIFIVLTIIVLMLKELYRVYTEHGQARDRHSRHLWLALAGFGGVLLVASLLAIQPGTQAAAAYLAAWGFVAFVIVAEVIAHRAQPDPVADPDLSLPDVLGEWSPAPVYPNGRYTEQYVA